MSQGTTTDTTAAGDRTAPAIVVGAVVRAALIVVAAGAVPAVMFALVSAYGYDIPWADELSWLGPIVALKHGTLSYMNVASAAPDSVLNHVWVQHNEHRVFVPAVFALILSLFGGWSTKREELMGVAVVTLQLAMIWRMLRATVPATAIAPLFAAASLLLFSLSQYENWVWGFQIAWFTGVTLAVTSVYLLTQPRLGKASVRLALAASVGAAYSLAFGLVSPVIGMAILLLRRDVSPRVRWLWAGVSVAAYVIYAVGYRAETGAHGGHANVALLPNLVRFVVSYLGSPLGGWDGLSLSSAFGCVGLLIFAVAAFRFGVLHRNGDPYAAKYLPWVALSAFVVVNAIVTAYGRVGWGAIAAVQSRYTTVTVLFWVAVVSLAAVIANDRWARDSRPSRAAALAIGGVVAVFFSVAFVRAELHGYAMMRESHARIEGLVVALGDLSSASDVALLELYSPNVNVGRVAYKLMALSGLGPLAAIPDRAFAGRGDEPAFGQLDTFAVQSPQGDRNVTEPIAAGSSIVVRGWAFDSATLKPGATIAAQIDEKEPRQAVRYGLSTPALAAGFFSPNLANAGFEIAIDTRGLSPGPHAFAIVLRTQGNPWPHRIDRSVRTFQIAGGAAAASHPLSDTGTATK